MNSSHHAILVLITILTCFVLNSYFNSSEKFTYSSVNSTYTPNSINLKKTIPINQYAKK